MLYFRDPETILAGSAMAVLIGPESSKMLLNLRRQMTVFFSGPLRDISLSLLRPLYFIDGPVSTGSGSGSVVDS